jgi:nucleoside-triphosphatase
VQRTAATTPAAGNVLLITGVPGIGKTTVVKKVIHSVSGLRVAGFYTEEIRESNSRQGFSLVTLNGKKFIMARIGGESLYHVGKYGVDVRAIDTAVKTGLSEERNSELFIIDEIGKMECLSELFVTKISSILVSGKPLVATIALKGAGFIAKVKNRTGVALWEITKKNRDHMPVQVTAWIRERLD